MERGRRRGRHGWIFWVLGTAVLGGAVVYEALRSRPQLSEEVQSRPPLSAEEISRLESGFSLSASRDGVTLFDLVAQSQVGLRGGASFVRGVDSFTFYTEDGRPIVVRAARGRIQGVGSEEAHIQAALEGDVLVRTPDGMTLRTEELIYDTRERLLRSPGSALLAGRGATARLAGFTYGPDEKVVEATGAVEIIAGPDSSWRLDTGRAFYRVESGELAIRTPFRARQPGRTLFAGPGTFAGPEAPATARLQTDGPVLLAGETGTATWQIAAGALDAEGLLPEGGGALARTVRLGPPASLALRDPGQGLGFVRTEGWLLEADEAGRPVRALAGPVFDARWDAVDARERWTLSGEWLELQADAAGAPRHAEARGAVRATGADGTVAEGRTLTWDAAQADVLLLRGDNARVVHGLDVVEAPRILLDRAQDLFIAEDGPLTEAASLRRGEGALFRGDEPVRVRSARVVVRGGEGPIDFEGPVQAWQEDGTLRAAHLKLLRGEERLLADGRVQLSLPVGDPGTTERRRVRLITEHLDYDGRARRAVLTGGATYEEPQTRIEAERIDAILGEDGRVQELTAVGRVRLLVQGNTGRADRLEWRGGPEGIVTLFGERAPATLESPEQGRLKQQAARIRYDLKARRGTAEGRGGRTTLEGSPPPRDE